MNQKAIKLIDKNSELMECRVCCSRHFENIRPFSKGVCYLNTVEFFCNIII